MNYQKLDLQLFAEEKTEQPTPKKREDSRKKGQVAKSKELSMAIVLMGAFAMLGAVGGWMGNNLMEFFTHIYVHYMSGDITLVRIEMLMFEVGLVFIRVVAPIAMICLFAGIASQYIQSGLVLSHEPIVPKFEKLNPLEGMKRIISKQAVVELIKSVVKFGAVFYIVYSSLVGNGHQLGDLFDMELSKAGPVVWNILVLMGLKAGLALVVIGVLDYLYRIWEHEQSIRMTKQEVKDESKQLEGDPTVRAKRREVMKKMSANRIMKEVPEATVILTNPTHVAVAIKYEPEEMAAPRIVGKGQDHMALRIKELARNHGIPVIEKPLLARTLYKACDVGQEIPENLYKAVAEVLAFIYSLKSRRK